MPAPAWYYVVWCGGSFRKLGDFVEDQQSRAGAIQQVQDTRTTTTSGNYDLVSGIAGGPTRQGAVPRACRQVEDTQATNNDDGNDGGDGGMPFFENEMCEAPKLTVQRVCPASSPTNRVLRTSVIFLLA